MQYRAGRHSDFAHLETFVWQAIFPAFDRPGLTDEQRAENDAMVESSRDTVISALDRPGFAVYTAWDDRRRAISGYVIVDASPRSYAEIVQLIVKRSEWGRGVAQNLLDLATDFIGRDRAVQLAVRAFNERAIAFFEKNGFNNTGESAGDFAIDRILMLREAHVIGGDEEQEPDPEETAQQNSASQQPSAPDDDFPTAADEPLYESLPDYTLAVDEEPHYHLGDNALKTEELPDLSSLDPAESSLTDGQLKTLEEFIARARAKKGKAINPSAEKGFPPDKSDPGKETPPVSQPRVPGKSKHPHIEFEIDYGEEPELRVESKPKPEPAPKPNTKSSPPPTTPQGSNSPRPSDRSSSDNTPLFEFDFAPAPPPPEEVLVLEDITEPVHVDEMPEVEAPPEIDAQPSPPPRQVSLSELRTEFNSLLNARLTAYFPPRRVKKSLTLYTTAEDFHSLRDGSLSSLAKWLNTNGVAEVRERRTRDTLADLVEYFIVETAKELHGGDLPQRLLRYQGVNWETVDLFRLCMDYLDFPAETETVYTDFVTIPAKTLKNASQNFLGAGRDERVFFICDQSVFGSGKHGFALTDSAIYWRSILQPAGAATFTTLRKVAVEGDHLAIDGQFFNAGTRLNLKVALLLHKLSRMHA